MTVPPEQKPTKKKTKKIANSKKANNANVSNNQNNQNNKANGRKKRKSVEAGSTAMKKNQKRGRSATKRKVKVKKAGSRNSSLQGSFSSLGSSNKSTISRGSQDSFSRIRASSTPDLRPASQDTTSSGRGVGRGRVGMGKRPRSASGLNHSDHRSPNRRLDMAGRGHSTSSIRRPSSNPNLSRVNSNSSIGGRGGSRPRSLRSLSGDGSPSSFTQRRLNRLGSRMKRSESAGGLSRQSSRSSLCLSSDDEGSRPRSNRSKSRLHDSANLQTIIGMIESSNPDILARKKSPSRYQRWAQRNRLSSQSLDSSGHTISSFGSDEFPPGETIWKSGLRYIRILSPTPKECKSDRTIRYMIWGAMILDFIAAMVSILTYESVTMCCGKPIFELLESRINWNEFVRISTYLYLLLIFLEIIPVFNKEIPLNLINPLIGFTITLAMFFDDRIGEAITMWAIEALAIIFETVITWLKRKQYQRHVARIEECDEELAVRDGKRWRRGRQHSSKSGGDGVVVDDPYSDLESLSGGSFYNSSDAEVNRFRIERERRQLKSNLKNEEINLRYHYIGSGINISLVLITLIFIIGIGKNGGLCISNFEAPPIFKDDQLERCPACVGASGTCEVCDTTGGNAHQCYYPYKL